MLSQHREKAFVMVPFALSPDIATLYAGFGISAPPLLRRSPQFIVLDDDEVGAAYNRYREADSEPVDLDDLEDIE